MSVSLTKIRSAPYLAALSLVITLLTSPITSLPTNQNEAVREGNYRDFRGDNNNIDVEDSVVRHLDPIGGGHILRNLDGLGGGHVLRQTRSGLDSLSGVTFGGNKRFDSLSGITFGNQKRNFDEIDRSGFDSFVKKNFDEIDRSGFNSFVKKNFDEIDRSGFNSFVKRTSPWLLSRYYEKENH